MPQFDSTVKGREGEWVPCDKAAEADCKLKGIDHLGMKVKPKTETGTQPYPVMAEAQNELPRAGADNKFPEIRKRGEVKKKEA